MVTNFPGPYEVRILYDTTPTGQPRLFHQQRLNVALVGTPAPGTPFSAITAVTRGGVSTPTLSAAVDAWLTLMQPIFHTTSGFGLVELWKYTPNSFEAQFISSYNSALIAGTSPSVSGVAQQDVYTFRTLEGGIMRINFMEGINRPYQKQLYPTLTGAIDAVFAFIIGTTNWILARDTSYPFAALHYLAGQNEKLFRIRFRP
ncbi:MAG: hypothetical protein ACREAZ_13270 [Nitrososphaera sp.]